MNFKSNFLNLNSNSTLTITIMRNLFQLRSNLFQLRGAVACKSAAFVTLNPQLSTLNLQHENSSFHNAYVAVVRENGGGFQRA